MSECSNCGKTMLFARHTIEGRRYCSGDCAQAHPILVVADRIPVHVLQQYVEKWRNGPCPRCKRVTGSVDVYSQHRVHSFLLMTQWSSRRAVSCRSCGRKSQLAGLAYSGLLGWWGVPWGLIVTPIQVTRNLFGALRGEPMRPTLAFEAVVRRQLAEAQIQQEQASAEQR
ncbi:hypothetical protein FHW69_001406 [Luteibacter sp. Sphag1AF]|uniref:hypothetical protein n=1 Tax=Luteibacter sp. Sphag1AF TaxID=2587031 RepID=UPI001613654F|nr:hypothetical protein [Luteibacter sp. Sphag1AF]MBB3226805.1 hypothetical protein [Luteibacter sp. Sphag1AF]